MITRRGFLTACAAAVGAAVLLGKEAVAQASPNPTLPNPHGESIWDYSSFSYDDTIVEDTFLHSDSTPEDFRVFAEIFVEEIRATMSRPSFCSRIFKPA
jgi:hypothetical protein